jgi:cell division protein FtsL
MKYLARSLAFILPVLAIFLVVTQVIVSNELATLGKKLGKLDTDISFANDMHEALATEVASASSMIALKDRAIAAGFHAPTKDQVMAISVVAPVAFSEPHVPLQ